MKSYSAALILVITSFSLSGCYTQLMTPQEFVQSRRTQSATSLPDVSYSLNYNQSCTSCHSVSELDERAEEMEYYGVRNVHNGYLLSSRDWYDDPVTGGPILIASPNPFWPNPYTPPNAWWSPGGSPPSEEPSGNRLRTDGPTRDGNKQRERTQTTAPTTYPQPQSPVGTSQPSIPTTPTTVTQQPATPPASTNDSGQNRQSGTTPTGRTRTDGSSRDGSGDRPK
ncbi:MAG: hypothetical protein WCW35_02445 [Bacteroidota bacterium]